MYVAKIIIKQSNRILICLIININMSALKKLYINRLRNEIPYKLFVFGKQYALSVFAP